MNHTPIRTLKCSNISWKIGLLAMIFALLTYFSIFLLLNYRSCSAEGLESKFYLAEVIPSGLEFDNNSIPLPNIGDELVNLINSAKSNLVFTSFYFSLIERSNDSTKYNDTAGRVVLEALENAGRKGVNMYFIANAKSEKLPSQDLEDLKEQFPDNVFIKFVNMSDFSEYKTGIFHIKSVIVDQISFYLGSSNADYRAYSEIVEIGVFGWNNPVVAGNLMKIANVYFPEMSVYIAQKKKKEQSYFCGVKEISESVKYSFNSVKKQLLKYLEFDKSERIILNPDTQLSGYITFSPVDIITSPFQWDALALVSVINSAKKSLVIAIMDYAAGSVYLEQKIYWNMIDRALRRAAFERSVNIRIITNITRNTYNIHWNHVRSLAVFGNILVKILELPPTPEPQPPFSRLWHAKFAVSETEAWISTNNAVPDYFLAIAGASFHICYGGDQFPEIRRQMRVLFNKYWYSNYTKRL